MICPLPGIKIAEIDINQPLLEKSGGIVENAAAGGREGWRRRQGRGKTGSEEDIIGRAATSTCVHYEREREIVSK